MAFHQQFQEPLKMYRHFNFKKADRREIEGNMVGGGEKKETGKYIFKTPINLSALRKALSATQHNPSRSVGLVHMKIQVIFSKLIKWDCARDAVLKSACLRGNNHLPCSSLRLQLRVGAHGRRHTNRIPASRDVNPPKPVLTGTGQMELNHPVGVPWTEGPQISAAENPRTTLELGFPLFSASGSYWYPFINTGFLFKLGRIPICWLKWKNSGGHGNSTTNQKSW